MPKPKAKILFIGKANTKPRFGKPRGAPQRAERNEFPSQNALGGALRRRGKFQEKRKKFYRGAGKGSRTPVIRLEI